MSLSVNTGVLQETISAITRAYIGQNNVMLALMDNQLDGGFAQGTERYKAQRRTYATGTTSVGRAKANGLNRDWSDSKKVEGTAIVINLRDGYELAYDIPRLDYLQSPPQ